MPRDHHNRTIDLTVVFPPRLTPDSRADGTSVALLLRFIIGQKNGQEVCPSQGPKSHCYIEERHPNAYRAMRVHEKYSLRGRH